MVGATVAGMPAMVALAALVAVVVIGCMDEEDEPSHV